MDANGTSGSHSIRHTHTSSSSAVDLSTTGLGTVLSDPDDQTYTHRRPSWINVEGESEEPGPSSLAALHEHPFGSHQLDESPTSLVDAYVDTGADDDEARLIGEGQSRVDGHWPGDLSADAERSAGFTSHPRGRSTAPFSLQKTIANAFHRASMRVADVQPYIPIQEDGEDADSHPVNIGEPTPEDAGEGVASQTPSTPLRGRALGFLGPTNPLRLRLYKLLIHPYVCSRPIVHLLTL